MEVKGKKTGVLLIYQKDLWLRGAKSLRRYIHLQQPLGPSLDPGVIIWRQPQVSRIKVKLVLFNVS